MDLIPAPFCAVKRLRSVILKKSFEGFGTELVMLMLISPRMRKGSGVGGVNVDFFVHGHPSVPAAITLLLLDARVVLGLVAWVAKVGQHVRPEAFIL